MHAQVADRAGMRLTAADLAAERGGRTVFSGIDFSLAAGEMLAVTGPNGAGKSTLLRLIAGLLAPSAGEIRLDPEPDTGRGAAMHYLGHLDGLKLALTVAANLRFWRTLLGGAADTGDALDAVGLGHVEHLPAAALSAGQRRRVAIARLLVAPRPVWLLDEPTTALDAAAEGMLGVLVRDHLARGGMIVVATHREMPHPPTATLALGA